MFFLICLCFFICILYEYHSLKNSTKYFKCHDLIICFFIVCYHLVNSIQYYKILANKMTYYESAPTYTYLGAPVATAIDVKPEMLTVSCSCILVIIFFIICTLRYLKGRKARKSN